MALSANALKLYRQAFCPLFCPMRGSFCSGGLSAKLFVCFCDQLMEPSAPEPHRPRLFCPLFWPMRGALCSRVSLANPGPDWPYWPILRRFFPPSFTSSLVSNAWISVRRRPPGRASFELAFATSMRATRWSSIFLNFCVPCASCGRLSARGPQLEELSSRAGPERECFPIYDTSLRGGSGLELLSWGPILSEEGRPELS